MEKFYIYKSLISLLLISGSLALLLINDRIYLWLNLEKPFYMIDNENINYLFLK